MYRKIIVGYDGSDQAKDALALGKDLSETTGAELYVADVSLIHPVLRGGPDPLDLEAEQESAEELRFNVEVRAMVRELLRRESSLIRAELCALPVSPGKLAIGSSV